MPNVCSFLLFSSLKHSTMHMNYEGDNILFLTSKLLYKISFIQHKVRGSINFRDEV